MSAYTITSMMDTPLGDFLDKIGACDDSYEILERVGLDVMTSGFNTVKDAIAELVHISDMHEFKNSVISFHHDFVRYGVRKWIPISIRQNYQSLAFWLFNEVWGARDDYFSEEQVEWINDARFQRFDDLWGIPDYVHFAKSNIPAAGTITDEGYDLIANLLMKSCGDFPLFFVLDVLLCLVILTENPSIRSSIYAEYAQDLFAEAYRQGR